MITQINQVIPQPWYMRVLLWIDCESQLCRRAGRVVSPAQAGRSRCVRPQLAIPSALGRPTVRDVPLALAGDIAVLLLAQHAPGRLGNPDRRVRAPGRRLVALPVDGGGFAADGLIAQVVAGLGAETVDAGRVMGEG